MIVVIAVVIILTAIESLHAEAIFACGGIAYLLPQIECAVPEFHAVPIYGLRTGVAFPFPSASVIVDEAWVLQQHVSHVNPRFSVRTDRTGIFQFEVIEGAVVVCACVLTSHANRYAALGIKLYAVALIKTLGKGSS